MMAYPFPAFCHNSSVTLEAPLHVLVERDFAVQNRTSAPARVIDILQPPLKFVAQDQRGGGAVILRHHPPSAASWRRAIASAAAVDSRLRSNRAADATELEGLEDVL
jgi:hypothetical protein